MREVAVVLLSAALLSGCGSDNDTAEPADGPVVGATPSPSSGGTLDCAGREVSEARLAERIPATELSPSGQEAVRGRDVRKLGDLSAWLVIEDSAKTVTLVREIRKPEPDDGAGRIRTHELVTITHDFHPSIPGWFMSSAADCELRRTFDGLESSIVELDPAHLPRPGDTTVRVLVTEQACAGGRPATGLIRVLAIEPAADSMGISVGVAPRSGAQTCQGNPATPYELELPEALGDRALVDVGVYPARELKPSNRASR